MPLYVMRKNMNLDYIFKRFSMITPKVLVSKTKLNIGNYSDQIFMLYEIYSKTTVLYIVYNFSIF